MKITLAALGVASALGLSVGAASAQQPMDHGKMAGSHDMKGMGGSHMAMADKDFMASMQKMHKEMMSAKGGSVDATFAKKMIAHHQGAIDMAKIELQHGTDAQAKRLAQTTIDENTKGIQELRDWLRQHGG